ncbi:MAG: hypothetical protein PVH91_08170 [Pseudomonadales bacterium]
MDLNHLRRACGVGLLTAVAFTNPTAHAANANVTVDISLPTVLVMYYYSTINLTLDETELATYLALTSCGGADYCADLGTTSPTPGAIVAGASTVPVNLSAAAPGSTTINFTLTDAVGVRALGCATYTANYADSGTSGAGVTIPSQAIAGIDGQACSFTMATGDLDFDLDLGAVDDNTSVQAVFDVTITGA